MAEGVLEGAVRRGRAYVQEGLHGRPGPAHLLRLVHALGRDLIDRTLHERRRDRLSAPTPGRVGHQCALVTFEVAQQVAHVSLEAADAGHLAYRLASRPAAQGRGLALAPRPAPVPETPLRTVQGANRRVGEVGVGRARAETPRCLPRVLEAYGGIAPVQHPPRPP